MHLSFAELCRLTRAGAGVIALAALAGSAGARGNGLSATLSLDADSYAMGQPIFFVITLANKGPAPVQAHLPRKDLYSFDLEMAFGDGGYRQVEFRQLAPLTTRPALREFKPEEVVGASKPMLLKGWKDKPPVRLVKQEGADLSRWLICARPGSYRLRAKVRVDLGKERLELRSNEVRFRVTPAVKGYPQFVKFAVVRFRDGVLQLSGPGYKAAEQVLEALEGTLYHRYVKWAMMAYFQRSRLDDEELPEYLSEKEKAQRQAYKRFAEQVLAEAKPRRRRSAMGEAALVYLCAYYCQEGDLKKSLNYARTIRDELPWSRYTVAADALEGNWKNGVGRRQPNNPLAR